MRLRPACPPCSISRSAPPTLQPPEAAIAAIREQLGRPESAAYCLHAATLPFREAVAAWAQRRFGVAVDPEREVLLLVGSQEGTAHLPLAVLNPGDAALLLDPYYPSHLGGLQPGLRRAAVVDARSGQRLAAGFRAARRQPVGGPEADGAGLPPQPHRHHRRAGLGGCGAERALRHDMVLAHDNPYVDLALEGEAPALLRHPGWRSCGIEFFLPLQGLVPGGLSAGLRDRC